MGNWLPNHRGDIWTQFNALTVTESDITLRFPGLQRRLKLCLHLSALAPSLES